MAKKSFLGALQTDNPALAFLSATAPQQQKQPESQPTVEEPVAQEQDIGSQRAVNTDDVVIERVENGNASKVDEPTTLETPQVEEPKQLDEIIATEYDTQPTTQVPPMQYPTQPAVSDQQSSIGFAQESDQQRYETPVSANVVSLMKPVRVIEPKRPYNRQESSIVVHEQSSGMLSFTIEKPKEKKTVRFSVMTRQSTKDRLIELSNKTGRSVNDLVDILVTYGLSKVDMNGLMVLDDD